ncbi:hypothetical protein QEN19_002418 [Hanseniaspora menglaensis]
MAISTENIPQNLDELKDYILSFNMKEQVAPPSANSDSLDYMSIDQSALFQYINSIQEKISPLRYKYNRLLSSLATFEFEDNSSFETKKIVFLNLRDEIVTVLKGINQLNKQMAPLQNIIASIIKEDQSALHKFPQTLNAINLPQSMLNMPKAQQLKSPNYEVTAQPLIVNTKLSIVPGSSKKGSISSPSAAIGSAPSASAHNQYNSSNIGSSAKRRSTKSTPQSISPYVNLHSAGTQQHSFLQQQLASSNNTTPNYINSNGNNINTNTMIQNSNLGLKSLSPEDILKQSNLNSANKNINRSSTGNEGSTSTNNNLNSIENSLAGNSLNLNFDFDNFDDFLK